MARRKKIIIGNWKMNPGTTVEAKKIFSQIKRKASGRKNILTVICPADIHLVSLAKLAEKSPVRIGVQDVFWQDQGFFTGQVSPSMAYNAGARYAIIGHSEKRKLGETSAQVAKKVNAVINDRLVAILCVGEHERDSEGHYIEFLKNQILSSLAGVDFQDLATSVIIAYEPVWEIGRKDMQAMKPGDVHQTAILIKKILNDAYNNRVAVEVPIIYGGSVSADNASKIIYKGEVDGLLVGRQSLEPQAFGEILRVIDENK